LARAARTAWAPSPGLCLWGIGTHSTAWVYQTYRRRFGIETSCRQLHEAHIKTSTRDPTLRLLLIGIALILRNIWVWVHYPLLVMPCRGGRKLNLGLPPFKMLLLWLALLGRTHLWYCRQCRRGTSALTITPPAAFANGVNLELLRFLLNSTVCCFRFTFTWNYFKISFSVS
jgi:hypothetical protein